NFSNIITGKQNEYIYFGSNITGVTADNEPGANNTYTGAIKWRVLAAKDKNGYSSGNMLLWADYQLGSAQYNPYYNNYNYAFYGTSMIRAKLNGGTYYTGSNQTANPTNARIVDVKDSWFYKLFEETERGSVALTSSYQNKLYSYDASHSVPKIYTTGIVGSGSGQYNTTSINGTSGTYASVSGTSVIETLPAADSLFLLDYYDINNTDYGFGDDGIVYANKVNSSWTSSSDGYPSYYDSTSATSNNLIDITGYYWLRPAGRFSTTISCALAVHSSGYVLSNYVNDTRGIRPAFNLDASNVIYATAADVSSNGNAFTLVNSVSSTDGKPAYKVYLKTSNYVNYNDQSSGAPIISASDKTV
ncbi:MAG: hypothetical protein K2H36_06815, partial [Clostridia bacterium]|nr:hypothetical protein [Clostridia bacterium]